MSFTVSASVERLRVDTVNEGSPDWELPVIEACLRTSGEALAAIPAGNTNPACVSSLYVPIRVEEPSIRWTEGYSLTFEGISKAYARVIVRKSADADPVRIDGFAPGGDPITRTVTDGSILLIPWLDEAFEQRPVLPLRGRLVIGDVPNASDALLLRSGTYEIRQNLGLNPRPTVVATGTLTPGDRIGFATRRPPLWRRGLDALNGRERMTGDLVANAFVTELSPLHQGFDIVATTPAEYSALRLTRIGIEPTIIPITWTERLRADALPIGISTLIGLLAGMLALANTYFKQPEKK